MHHPIRTRVICLKFYINLNCIFTFLLFIFYSCYHRRLTFRGRSGSDLRGCQWSGVSVSTWFVISSDFSKSKQNTKLANWFTMRVKKCWNCFLKKKMNVTSEPTPKNQSLHLRNGMLPLRGRRWKRNVLIVNKRVFSQPI